MAEHTISENLQRLKDSKSAIGNAIIAKGGTVGATDGLEEFAADIMSIKNDVTSIDITENGTYYSGDKTIVTSSVFPIVIDDSNGIPVRHANIDGNTVQSGTPSSDNPVIPEGTGDITANLFDKSTAVLGERVLASSVTTDAEYAHTDYINIEGYTYITVNKVHPANTTNIYFYAEKTNQSIGYYKGTTTEIPSGAKYVRVNLSPADIDTFMLNSGSTSLPYEPYGYKIPFSSGGENLCIQFEHGGIQHSDGGLFDSDYRLRSKDFIQLAAGTYTISGTYNFAVRVYDTSKNYIAEQSSSVWSEDNLSFTISDGFIKIVVANYDTNTYIPLDIQVMLNSGPTALPYEPYNRTTTPVYLGKVETTRQIKKLVLDGTENWAYVGTSDDIPHGYFRAPIGGINTIIQNMILATHFIQAEITASTTSAGIDVRNVSSQNAACINVRLLEMYTSAADFKSYLQQQYAAGTPVTVWYVLETEETSVVNEPLMKIGEYVDSLSVDVELPLLQNTKNNINVDTTVKPFSASFTYNKLSEYIGYNEINVDVSNTYIVEDEGKVVNNATLVPQTAMSTEITVNDTYDTTLYNSIVVNVPSAPTPTPLVKSDVTFYDYDGTIVQSYSANDFANLSELPANPTHEGLTAQGWNWSLADAKTYVANYGSLDIGQQYVTNDGKTRIYINLTEGRISPLMKLYLNANTELDIDWGDGSTHSTWTTISAAYKNERHNYPDKGKYVIAITVVSGSFIFQSSTTQYNTFFTDGKVNSNNSNKAYLNSIQKIEIGTGITSIGDYAFYQCTSLSSITIPNNATMIGSNAFGACYVLSSITIPNKVTSIGSSTFYYCYSLSSVNISNSVTAIGDKTFQYCYSLSSVTIPNKVTIIGNYAFGACYSLSSTTISNGVTSIKDYAFQSCSSLSSITIPNDDTTIGNYAFQSCSSLSSINIPNNATMIGSYVFQSCYSLSSLTIPNKVTTIGSYAFRDCYSLYSITIPDKVTTIGSSAFQGCNSVDYIRFTQTTPPTVSASSAWSSVPTSTIFYIPALVSNLYMDGTNYPSKSSYKYIGYATYASGETLPSTTTDETYTLTWYATSADAISQTNPITQGTGDEVYSRATPVA